MAGLKVLMLGAHLDDNDFCAGGIALKYLKRGDRVRFLSLCNGNGGHHIHTREEIAARRYGEAQAVAAMTGIEYDVWDINDCEIMADLETRKRLIRYIREYSPDVIFTHRTNDYHADHRNTALLVQDASYLLIVPNFCPEARAMERMPVIMFYRDRFTNPPFEARVVVDIDEVIDEKFEMMGCHESQVYEWLPFTHGTLKDVPTDKGERLNWLRSPLLPKDRVLSEEELNALTTAEHCEAREAISASKYRNILTERYGEKGERIIFAEAFGVSEYGSPLTKEKEKELFPF